MSHVCNIVLLMSTLEEVDDRIPALERLNQWLSSQSKGQLHRVDGYGSNSKVMECIVAIGAFNYLHLEEFLRVFRGAGWEDVEGLSLMVMDEGEERFREVRLDHFASQAACPNKYTAS